MNKSVLWFVTVVIVSARCSAESIPAINRTSGFAVLHSTQEDKHGKQNIQGSDEEERGTFPIESFISSVKAADESLPGTIHKANMVDVSEIKEHNKVLATRMETLRIDLDGVVLVTKALKSAFKDFSLNNIEWMILGKVYFERDRSSTSYKVLRANQLFKELNMEIIDKVNIKKWIVKLNNLSVRANNVFGKMLWLLQTHNELNLDLTDAAKMAFGSEYLKTKKNLPSSGEILDAVGRQNVDKDLVESILRQDKDSKKRKAPSDLGPFAIESLTSLVKTADESLPRTKNAATVMDVSEIKERNQVLDTQMEKLGIDVGGVVFVTGALESKFGKFFSRNSLGWMVLGKVFFKKAGRSSEYRSLSARELCHELNMEIIDNEGIANWIVRLNNVNVRARKVFGKMLWLLQTHNELNLDLADAAKMSVGSETLETRKLPFSDELLQAVTEQHVDNDVTEALIPQVKDSTMTAIARNKLLEMIRNDFNEEVHEQPNKKRKLA